MFKTDSLLANLQVFTDGHRIAHHTLSQGATLMVGSGANCGIRLNDPALSSIHCVFRLTDRQLYLQDWCSALGTYVDGQRVEEETAVPDGSRVLLGDFEIQVQFVGGSADPSEVELGAAPGAEVAESESDADAEDGFDQDQDTSGEPVVEETHDAERPQRNRDTGSVPEADPRPTAAGRDACPNSSPGGDTRVSRPRLPASVDPETVSLLQAEIECLQSELSERDRQLTELQELVDGTHAVEPDCGSAEIDALAARLEQLLEELAGSDQRTRVLEELLQAEQDVARSQQEEVAQTEAWLNDIEQRIAQREQEWQAEREALLRRVEQVKAERDEADSRIAAAEQSPHGVALQRTIVKELRVQIDQLQDKLNAAQRAREAQAQEIEQLSTKSPEQTRDEYIEAALREERLKLAQERAELSRERAQMARRLAEVEGTARRERRSEADERFRVFRQTLKELHKQEKPRSTTVHKATLGSRIAELWRKLDGPSDTD
jgi:hypothetical protein